MGSRYFFTQKDSRDILIEQARSLRARADAMPPGVERDRLIKQARQIEVQANIQSWALSPDLQAPAGDQ